MARIKITTTMEALRASFLKGNRRPPEFHLDGREPEVVYSRSEHSDVVVKVLPRIRNPLQNDDWPVNTACGLGFDFRQLREHDLPLAHFPRVAEKSHEHTLSSNPESTATAVTDQPVYTVSTVTTHAHRSGRKPIALFEMERMSEPPILPTL